MIKKSIEPETKVWNDNFGFGMFKSWSKIYGNDLAVINFELGDILVSRKELTEIEDEPKEKQKFNPPV